jgi:hypothetical protein
MKTLFCTLFLSLFFFIGNAAAQSAPAPAALDTVAAKVYLGKYDTGGMGNVFVTLENGKIMGELEGQGKAELAPAKDADVFMIMGMDGIVTFLRDDSKKIVKLQIAVQGQVIEATKL